MRQVDRQGHRGSGVRFPFDGSYHFELQNRTQVNGTTLITPRGIVFSGASDCTDAGKMGTGYMEGETQDLIVDGKTYK